MTDPDGNDPSPIVDDNVGITKKITLTQLRTWLQTLVGWISTAMLADASITNAKVAAGAAVQYVYTNPSAASTGTTVIPLDDTIPQNNEGFEVMTLTITPRSATNILVIEATAFMGNANATQYLTVALFQDSIANALAAENMMQSTAAGTVTIPLTHPRVSGTVSPITFKIRVGSHQVTTTTFNGSGGSRQFATTPKSSLTITEYKA